MATTRASAVWKRRQVLAAFVKRDLKEKYQQSVLGYAWALLEPLLLTGIYFFVFAQILRAGTEDYGLFLVSGILPWLWFNRSVMEATRVLTKQSKIITSMSLPREVFPLGVVGARFVDYIVSLPLLAVFAVITGREPHATVLGLLPAIALQTILLTGLTMILASVTVLLRDVERVIRMVLRLIFYLSGVLYPLSIVPAGIRTFFELNPLVGIFQLHRAVWFPNSFPQPDVLIMSSAISVAVFLLGWWMFHALEPAVLKEL